MVDNTESAVHHELIGKVQNLLPGVFTNDTNQITPVAIQIPAQVELTTWLTAVSLKGLFDHFE
jgi:hypothetical protein